MWIEEQPAALTAYFNLTPLAESREAFHAVQPSSPAIPCFGFGGPSQINNNMVIPHHLPGVSVSYCGLTTNHKSQSCATISTYFAHTLVGWLGVLLTLAGLAGLGQAQMGSSRLKIKVQVCSALYPMFLIFLGCWLADIHQVFNSLLGIILDTLYE